MFRPFCCSVPIVLLLPHLLQADQLDLGPDPEPEPAPSTSSNAAAAAAAAPAKAAPQEAKGLPSLEVKKKPAAKEAAAAPSTSGSS
jgi:hypothetical protein